MILLVSITPLTVSGSDLSGLLNIVRGVTVFYHIKNIFFSFRPLRHLRCFKDIVMETASLFLRTTSIRKHHGNNSIHMVMPSLYQTERGLYRVNEATIMLTLHLPRAPYNLFVYDFRTVFRHRMLDCGLRPMCLRPLYDFFDGFLQRTCAKP